MICLRLSGTGVNVTQSIKGGSTDKKAKGAVMTTDGDNAADRYAAWVDAVLAQRTRLRGPQPPGDLFAGLPSDHPLMQADPRRPLDPTPRSLHRISHRMMSSSMSAAAPAEFRCHSPCVAAR